MIRYHGQPRHVLHAIGMALDAQEVIEAMTAAGRIPYKWYEAWENFVIASCTYGILPAWEVGQ